MLLCFQYNESVCHGWQKHVHEPGTWEEEAGLGAQGYAVTLKVVWATWDPVLK